MRRLAGVPTPQRGFSMYAVVAVVACALAALALTGCGAEKSSGGAKKDPSTAKGSLEVARSAMETLAPDADLLLVQTPGAQTADSTAAWSYIFGNAENGKLYTVMVDDGKVLRAGESGKAPLKASEWKDVPDLDAWKIDSDKALAAAMKAARTDLNNVGYSMLLETYVPKSAGNAAATKPFVWYIGFEAISTEASSTVIAVDAQTGSARKQ